MALSNIVSNQYDRQENNSPFDSIRHYDEQGSEYWTARELMPLLGYTKWQRFTDAIKRAIISCENAQTSKDKHFIHLPGSVSGQGRFGDDYQLSRYACYLIAMNGDPRKPEISAAQSYFAIKTRQAETQSLQLPQNYIEALKALVAAEEKKELLKAQNELLEEQNHQLAEAVDELFDYSSIIRVAKFNGVSETCFKWQVLKATSIRMGLEIKRVPCPRFETKLLYSHDAWRVAYPNYKLPETTTIVIAR